MTQATLSTETIAGDGQPSTVLSFHNVTKSFPTAGGAYVAVRDVSLEIGRHVRNITT